jgi:surface carbohydrate biosynthesis protein
MSRRRFNDILLPIETANRELDGKLLLAMFAAEAGFNAHIGTKNHIAESWFGPAIYVAKSVRAGNHVNLMAQLGYKVVAWDEEGLVRFRDDIHKSRIERDAFSTPSTLFSWGPSNSAIWREHPFYDGTPIVESGNPRIDLLRPELRSLYDTACAQLRERYRDFVLLNTNFGFVNHFKQSGGGVVKAGALDGQLFATFKAQVDEHKRKIFTAFQKAVPEIAAAIAPRCLVIRPHPSEDRSVWDQVANGLTNVSVVYEGSIAQWLLASRCVIHNGCTTAVEARVMGRPALAYQPVTDPDLDIFLPNALSESFGDVASLAARLRDILDGKLAEKGDADRAALIRHHIASLEGPFACERIVETLSLLRDSDDGRFSPVARLGGYGMVLKRRLKRLLGHHDKRYETHRLGSYEFTASHIAERAGQFAKALGRFGDLAFEQRGPGVVTVMRNGSTSR